MKTKGKKDMTAPHRALAEMRARSLVVRALEQELGQLDVQVVNLNSRRANLFETIQDLRASWGIVETP